MSLRLPLLYCRVSYIRGTGMMVAGARGAVSHTLLESPRRGHSLTYPIRYARVGSLRAVGFEAFSDKSVLASLRSGLSYATRVLITSSLPCKLSTDRWTSETVRVIAYSSKNSVMSVLSEYRQDTTVSVDALFEGVRLSRSVLSFKVGSTLPYHDITFCRFNDPRTPLDLRGATVRIVAVDHLTEEIRMDKFLEILDAERGRCRIVRGIDEYATPSGCRAEFIITFGDGDVLIVPKSRYYRLSIEDSL